VAAEFGWDTWATLRARPHLRLRWAALRKGRGMIVDNGDGTRTISLKSSMGRRERSETLGHELVHDELDFVWPPDAPSASVEKGEAIVRRITADRCVPRGPLTEWVRARWLDDQPTSAADVSERWDVTAEMAATALELIDPLEVYRAG
jgi:hypothetical protein